MISFEERVKNLERFNNRKLHDDEKLELAFEIQDTAKFKALLKNGASPKLTLELAKSMGSGRLSICQCDMLKLIDEYAIKE